MEDVMEKNKALELWLDEIGNQAYSYDFSGKKIKMDDYLEKNEVGWTVTYIKPLELGGEKNKGNVIIMHYRTQEEKGLNYPEFCVGHKKYIAQYDVKGDFYYIEEFLDEEDD
jgi:hypothetical protein